MSFIYICCFEFRLFLPLVKHPMTRKLCIYTHAILTRCCHIIVKRKVVVMKPDKFLCCRFLFAFLALTVHTTEELTNRNLLIMYNVSVQKKRLCTVVKTVHLFNWRHGTHLQMVFKMFYLILHLLQIVQ